MRASSETSRRGRSLVMAGLLSGMVAASLGQGIIGTAMPRIVASLGGMALYSWTFTTYMLISTSMMPIFGKLSDIYGRRRLFLLGLVIFMVGSWLCGISQTMAQLIIFRGVQGLGAGIILPISLVAVADVFPPAQRGQMLGLIASLWGLASAVGPIVGGYVADNWSWPWVFYVNIPMGFLSLVLVYFYLHDRRDSGVKRRVDYLGAATLLAGLLPLLLALSLGGKDYAWDSPVILGFLSLAGLMLVLFLLVESRVDEPIIPLSLFRNSIFTVSIASTFLRAFSLFGVTTLFLPLFLQVVVGASATDSGFLLAPMTLGMVVTSALTGHLIAWVGYRKIAQAATGVMVAGVALLTSMDSSTTSQQAMLYILILGFAWGPSFPVFTIAAQNSVKHAQMGVATSSVQFFANLGFAMGATIMGALLANNLDTQIRQGAPGTLSGGLEQAHSLLNPSALSDMPPAVLSFFREALASSLHQVFLISLAVMIAAFVVTLFLKEIPLRRTWETETEELGVEKALPWPPAQLISREADREQPGA